MPSNNDSVAERVASESTKKIAEFLYSKFGMLGVEFLKELDAVVRADNAAKDRRIEELEKLASQHILTINGIRDERDGYRSQLAAVEAERDGLRRDLEREERDHLNTIDHRDKHEERINAISRELGLSEYAASWTSHNDPSERAIECIAAMMNAVVNGAAMVERAEKERDVLRTELTALREVLRQLRNDPDREAAKGIADAALSHAESKPFECCACGRNKLNSVGLCEWCCNRATA